MTRKSVFPLLAALVAVVLVGCASGSGVAPPGASSAPLGPPLTLPPTSQDLGGAGLGPTAAPTETPTGQVALPSGSPVPFPSINLLRMVDETNGWAFDPDGKLYRTADGGASWYLVTLPADVQVNGSGSAFLDAAHAWLPYYGANGAPALLRTADGGLTWTSLTGIGLADAGGAPAFRFTSPDDGLAEVAGVGAGNLYIQEFETHDGGATFQVIPLVGLTDEQGLPQGTIHLCNICTDSFHYDRSRAIIVEGDMATMEPRGAVHVRRSTDLGQHWSDQTLPLPAGYEDALVWGLPMTFRGDAQHGFMPVRLMKYAADGSITYDVLVIYTTPDGGETWNLTPTLLTGAASPATLSFPDDLDVAALCGKDICVSHDEARTWQTITPNVDFSITDTRYVLDMAFVTPEVGWLTLVEDNVYHTYKTIDGGSTWALLNP
jgi:photosystem II stability/assembly factor-like uncharacterized protein